MTNPNTRQHKESVPMERKIGQVEKTHKLQAEHEVQSASLDRGMRDLRYADLLDTARTKSESLTEVEQHQIANALERRKWGEVLRGLHKDDLVVSILSSTSDLLSIKNLNDNVFGPQTTDSIIAKRRQLTEMFFKRALSIAGVSADDLDHVSLEQNYKFGVFKIPGQYKLEIVNIVNQVCADVDSEMKKFIIALADEEESKHPKKKTFLQNFRVAVNNEGYKMTFGAAVVGSNELEDVVMAVNGSLQTARAVSFDDPNKYGDQYSEEKMLVKIEQTNELRKKIQQGGNKITNKDGVVYEIFVDNAGRLGLNKDLLRDVRKDKFVCADDQLEVLKDLKNYVKSLNIFDVVKPFTVDEFADVKESLKQTDLVAQGVLQGKAEDFARAAEILDTNEKDERFTSEARFHSESVKIKNCAYLSLDVLDVGVDQLLDFEQRIQSVVNKETTFTQASLEAGDLMTKKLRQMREMVYGICDEFQLTKNGRMDGLVGGDELTLAINLDAVDKFGQKIFDDNDEVLNRLILRLKKETNSRVVKTVIAESKRHSSSDNLVERMKEHLVALKNAEQGANQAKQIETELRKLSNFIKERSNDQSAKTMLENLKDFVMAEVDGHFVIRTESGPDMTMDQVLEKMKSLYS